MYANKAYSSCIFRKDFSSGSHGRVSHVLQPSSIASLTKLSLLIGRNYESHPLVTSTQSCFDIRYVLQSRMRIQLQSDRKFCCLGHVSAPPQDSPVYLL